MRKRRGVRGQGWRKRRGVRGQDWMKRRMCERVWLEEEKGC